MRVVVLSLTALMLVSGTAFAKPWSTQRTAQPTYKGAFSKPSNGWASSPRVVAPRNGWNAGNVYSRPGAGVITSGGANVITSGGANMRR